MGLPRWDRSFCATWNKTSNFGFHQGTHKNSFVTRSANKRLKEGRTGCVLGMCVRSLWFGSLALRLSRQIPVSHYYGKNKSMCSIYCLAVMRFWYLISDTCWLATAVHVHLQQNKSTQQSQRTTFSSLPVPVCLCCVSGCRTGSSSSTSDKTHSDSALLSLGCTFDSVWTTSLSPFSPPIHPACTFPVYSTPRLALAKEVLGETERRRRFKSKKFSVQLPVDAHVSGGEKCCGWMGEVSVASCALSEKLGDIWIRRMFFLSTPLQNNRISPGRSAEMAPTFVQVKTQLIFCHMTDLMCAKL